jgi:hypothetical protein
MSQSKASANFGFGTLLPRQNRCDQVRVEGELAAWAEWSDGLLMARLGPAEMSALQSLSGGKQTFNKARRICAGASHYLAKVNRSEARSRQLFNDCLSVLP